MSEGSGSATGTAAAAGTSSVAQPETSEVSTGASVAIPHVQLQLPAPDEIARPPTAAPSLLQQSAPATAATSMLTIVPAEDEKAEGRDQGATGAEGEGEASATGNVDLTDGMAAAAQPISSLPPASPQVIMTFLLISGTRRGMSFDPSTTVGRVKELVWNAWPGGVYSKSRILLRWDAERGLDCPANEEKPPAPNYLRILYLGKILQDEDTLAGKFRVRVLALEFFLGPLPFGCEMENRALVSGQVRLACRAALPYAFGRLG